METLQFDDNVTTPSGTPLGGWVHVEASDNGDYYVHFHMHSSSVFGSFDFNLRGVPHRRRFSDDGVRSERPLLGRRRLGPRRARDNPLLSLYWSQLKAGKSFSVAKDYQWSGVVGTLDDLVNDIFDLGAGVIGAPHGLVIARSDVVCLGGGAGPGNCDDACRKRAS